MKGTAMVKAYDIPFATGAAAREWANKHKRLGWFASQPWWNEVHKRWFVTCSAH